MISHGLPLTLLSFLCCLKGIVILFFLFWKSHLIQKSYFHIFCRGHHIKETNVRKASFRGNSTEPIFLYRDAGNSLVVQWLGLLTLTAKSSGSIPDQGTLPHAARNGPKKKPRPKNNQKFKVLQYGLPLSIYPLLALLYSQSWMITNN